jgi:membrane protein DedA with SNARE-associated domain
VQTVTHLLLHTSPLFICLLVGCVLLLESSGVPILNSTLLLFTGALASLGHLHIVDLTVFAVTGSVIGACVAYYIGKRGGRQVLFRLALLFHLNMTKVDMVEHWFQRSGAWMIFFSRMLPYARPFACFPAGIAQMSFMRFFCCALLGSLIWCVSLLTVGWNLGKRWELAVTAIQQYTVPVLALVAGLIVLYIFSMRLIKRFLHTRFMVSAVTTSDADECSPELISTTSRGFSEDQH